MPPLSPQELWTGSARRKGSILCHLPRFCTEQGRSSDGQPAQPYMEGHQWAWRFAEQWKGWIVQVVFKCHFTCVVSYVLLWVAFTHWCRGFPLEHMVLGPGVTHRAATSLRRRQQNGPSGLWFGEELSVLLLKQVLGGMPCVNWSPLSPCACPFNTCLHPCLLDFQHFWKQWKVLLPSDNQAVFAFF